MKPSAGEEPKTDQVRTMFDRIAPRYDLLNRVLSFGVDVRWRRLTVKAVCRDNPARVLDVATGTGDLALGIARKLPSVQVEGIDLSPEMVRLGQQKVAKAGLSGRITLSVGEAASPGFPDGTFDAVSAAFGVRNFEDLEAGIGGMSRMLRPGGTMAVLEFSTPRSKIFAALYRFYFHRVLPAIGGAVSGDREAYRYLPGSVDDFPSPEAFLDILRRAGLENGRARRLSLGIAYLYTAKKK